MSIKNMIYNPGVADGFFAELYTCSFINYVPSSSFSFTRCSKRRSAMFHRLPPLWFMLRCLSKYRTLCLCMQWDSNAPYARCDRTRSSTQSSGNYQMGEEVISSVVMEICVQRSNK